MTITTQTPAASQFAQAINAVAGILVVRARHFAQIIKGRRDAAMLSGMDDRMLADIGLTRGDLRDAYAEPLWNDPTSVLVSRAHERRVNRRRVSVGLAEKVFDAPSIVPPVLSASATVRYY